MRSTLKILTRLCISLFCVALYVGIIYTLISRASTTTPNLSMTLPAVGDAGWGTTLNNSVTTLDTQFATTSAGHQHTGTTGEGPNISITAGTSGTLTVGRGGTGDTTAPAARSNLGAAASGANTDITSLKGLTGNAIGIGTSGPAVAIQIEGTTLADTSIHAITASTTESMQLITARGRSGPSAVQPGDTLGFWSFRGHDGSSYGGTQASIKAEAAQTFSGSAKGTQITLSTTPNGSTTLTPAVVVGQDGSVAAIDTITSTRSMDLGWTVQNAANQACNTTCTTGACVVGINTDAFGAFLPCTNTSSDSCLCAK